MKAEKTSVEQGNVEQSGWIQLPTDVCDVCEGLGKIRANYTDENRNYVFHKEKCYACDGNGKMEYVKCINCGGIVPNGCKDEHDCPE